MKKIFFIFFTIVYLSDISAQDRKADSLRTLLLKAKEDTSKVMLLARLANNYRDNKPDTADLLAEQGITLAEKLHFEKGKAECLQEVGHSLFIRGDIAGGLEKQLEAMKIRERIGDQLGQIKSYVAIGFLYNYSREFNKGKAYLLKALDGLRKEANADDLFAETYSYMGNSYIGLKQRDSGFEYINKSLAIAQKTKNKERLAGALRGLASYYYNSGDTSLALEYHRRALANYIAINNQRQISWTQAYLGFTFKQAGKLDSALYYLKQSLEICKAAKNPWGIASNSSLLAQIYDGKDDKEALRYYKLAKVITDSLNSIEKTKQFQKIMVTENSRQQEIENIKLKNKEERKQNLQYVAITLGLVIFIILFLLLSHSVVANQKIIRFLGILALLIVFEFINLLLHPYLNNLTNHSTLLMLGIMVGIAALLIPVHNTLEKWITHRLVEKNNKIRLEAAKKTIARLEGEQTN